jgi:soluble lytic murein transglycosylase-like protein
MINKWVTRLPWDAISKVSRKMRVDPLLIGAIVSVESDGNHKAVRFESHYKWLYEPQRFASLNRISLDTEKNLQMSSMGLMQIMGANARAYGYMGPLTDLFEREIGLRYGIEHLTKLIDKYDILEDAISAYNQGSPRKKSNGLYSNQNYVDNIMTRFKYLKEL